MKKLLLIISLLLTIGVSAQDKKVINGNERKPNGTPIGNSESQQRLDVTAEKAKAQQAAITNIQQYFDISAEGTLYPKGTFPRKVDTTKVLVLYSTLDKVTGEDGTEFTSPKVLQKVMYVLNKPNSFSAMDYFDENMKPIGKELIIWQTKEFPKK